MGNPVVVPPLNADAVLRAHLLWNMHKLTAGMPVLDEDARLRYASQRLTAFDVALFDRVSEEDLALLNACLVLEHELRARAEDTLERLLALVSGGEGTLTERVLALPQTEQAAALVCLYELGWVYTDSV